MRSSLRWLVPLAVTATVAGGVAVGSAQAGNTPDLPSRTPQQVLASVAGSSVTALSGTVVTRADVGLPSISGLTGGQPAATTDAAGLLTRLLSGQNTLRVWADGPTRQRAQLLDPFSELDVVRNGSQVWTYASRGNLVQHATVPAHAKPTQAAGGDASALAGLTPAQLADRAIAQADPTTAVTLGTPALVAGRSTYALTLTPRTTATLVGRVVVAVDAERGVPLQVKVFARGHDTPSVETGFTSVDFGKPSADRFSFTPPKGATVTEVPAQAGTTPQKLPAADRPTVRGTGWASIVQVPASALRDAQPAAPRSSANGSSGSGQAGGQAGGLAALQQLTTPVAGGRAISTALLSVLFTDDGRVFAGAVPVDALVAAAAK